MRSTISPPNFHPRKATLEDSPALQTLIDLSVRTLHPAYYSQAVIDGALKHVYGVDTTLIDDGNYFVISILSPPSSRETIIACGGWSNRNTLYGGDQFASRDDSTLLNPSTDAAKVRAMFVHPDWTRKGVAKMLLDACEKAAREAGFKRVEMGATLSGVPFYERMGYREIEEKGGREMRDLGNGVELEVVRMGRDLC